MKARQARKILKRCSGKTGEGIGYPLRGFLRKRGWAPRPQPYRAATLDRAKAALLDELLRRRPALLVYGGFAWRRRSVDSLEAVVPGDCSARAYVSAPTISWRWFVSGAPRMWRDGTGVRGDGTGGDPNGYAFDLEDALRQTCAETPLYQVAARDWRKDADEDEDADLGWIEETHGPWGRSLTAHNSDRAARVPAWWRPGQPFLGQVVYVPDDGDDKCGADTMDGGLARISWLRFDARLSRFWVRVHASTGVEYEWGHLQRSQLELAARYKDRRARVVSGRRWERGA